MLPAGMGLHGLFLLSSSGSTLWFETQNWRRCSHTQNPRRTSSKGSRLPDASVPKAVCGDRRGMNVSVYVNSMTRMMAMLMPRQWQGRTVGMRTPMTSDLVKP